MNSDFFKSARQRVNELQERASGKISLLVSGGSASAFMLHLFATQKKPSAPMEAIYLQLPNYDWMEREQFRTLTRKLQIPSREIQLSPVPLTSCFAWKSLDENGRTQALWRFIDTSLGENVIAGLGWPQFQRVSSDLNLPGKTLWPSSLELSHVTAFYTPNMWDAFQHHQASKIFFDLWTTVPFDGIRYWQDYVFKQVIPEFQPSTPWQLQNFL